MSFRRVLHVLGGIAVSALFVWLLLRSISVAQIGQALSQTRPTWLIAGVAVFLIGYAVRIWRWKVMLAFDNPALRWRTCAVPFMASIAANNLLPFRAGDALRAVGFSGWLGVPTAGVMATLFVERLLDLLVLLLALGLATALIAPEGGAASRLLGLGSTALVAIALAVCFVLLFPRIIAWVAAPAVRVAGLRFPGLAERIDAQSRKLFGTLDHLAHGPRMLMLVLWSILAWSCEGAVFWCAAQAIPALTAPVAAWLALPVGTLSTLLPSTPGYVGTFHYFVAQAAQVFDNPPAAAAAFAVLVHLVLWLTSTLIGGACLVYWVLRRGGRSTAPLADGKAT